MQYMYIYITEYGQDLFHKNVTTSCPIYSIALVKCTMQAAKACTKKLEDNDVRFFYKTEIRLTQMQYFQLEYVLQ